MVKKASIAACFFSYKNSISKYLAIKNLQKYIIFFSSVVMHTLCLVFFGI